MFQHNTCLGEIVTVEVSGGEIGSIPGCRKEVLGEELVEFTRALRALRALRPTFSALSGAPRPRRQ
ncbi:hypothetical protein [Rhodococcus jostii]|uniref:hypothetical protein n=1 Tax=Rhodococcus jostii TaxID=132919 RepID=UPI00364ABD17